MHSPIRTCALLAASIFLSHFVASGADGDKAPVRALLPVTITPWKNVTKRLDSAEIVILCLVGSYDPEKPSEFGPGDSTPAQMLAGYLTGVRNLGLLQGDQAAAAVDYASKVKILIVEGGVENRHAPTREKAAQLHKYFKIPDYDKTTPVIYVVHKNKLVESYTYHKSPGRSGNLLRDEVVNLLSPKDKFISP